MSLRARLGFTQEPLYLMDASAFVFRGFYAYRNMARSDGFPTNALYIVARLLLKLLREERPAYFAFILDGKGSTFRHELFPAYKAQRSATPEPLVQQLPPIRALPPLLGVPILVSAGSEADDYIAAIAARFREERPVVILGADKDLKQCLHEQVILWDPSGKDEKITTLDDFQTETGMAPSSWPDYQALVGDSSDNIPGIAHVGPKTALEIMRSFPTLEELFDRLAAVPPKVRAKLEGQRENALLYRKLTTLSCEACPTITLDDLAVRSMNLAAATQFLQEYELHSLVRETQSMTRAGVFVDSGAGALALKPAQVTSLSTAPPKAVAPSPAALSAREHPLSSAKEGEISSPRAAEESENFFARSAASVVTGGAASVALEQGRLFATAPLAIPAEFSFPEVTAVADLPEPGASIALVRLEDRLVVASAEWERVFTGADADLSAWLAQSVARIATPDMKTLCKAHPPLWKISVGRWHDLGIAAYLLSPEERSYAWPALVQRWAEHTGSAYSADEHPGLLALDLFEVMGRRLTGAGLESVFSTLEMPLVPIIARLEERGIAIDIAAFSAFLRDVQTDLDRLTASVYSLAGRVFNIRSSQQLSDVLFTVLGLPKAGKTKGGAMSTSQEALEKLTAAHPVVTTLLEYRKLEKLRSTYLEPLPRLVDKQGRIHTTLNQTTTATGRLSSSNPNLQNIPVRGDLGGRMRGCFIAAPGKALVCADYSQIELRVLAHLSQDPTLLDAFRKNEDIHRRTASLLFDREQADITPEERRNAKTINFGLVYGMGAQKLAQELHISMTEAKAFIERYFSRLSVLKSFYETIEAEAREFGYVLTMTGRRRLTPEILSQNNQLRSQARRQAINTRIQGSAADIIKLAMIAVENDPVLYSLNARLLLQIHDELLLEAPIENAAAAGERLAALMGAVTPGGEALSVPLLVEWGSGHTWSEAH